jgi:hypothetical protein
MRNGLFLLCRLHYADNSNRRKTFSKGKDYIDDIDFQIGGRRNDG